MPVADLIERLRGQTMESEDGDELSLELYAPATDDEVAEIERRLGRPLDPSFRDFLRISNGMQLFGAEIGSCRTAPTFACASFASLDEYLGAGLVPFHAWGNGDHDAIDLGAAGDSGAAPIVFCNHNPGVRVRIADGFEEWIERAFEEMGREGALLHPSDFMHGSRSGDLGMYAHVPGELKTVDCELWTTFGGKTSGGDPGGSDRAEDPAEPPQRPWWKVW